MWTQTVVALAAGVSAPLIAANPKRLRLRWMVTSGGPVTIAPGSVTVTAGAGMIYNGPSAAGNEGSSEDFQWDVGQEAFSAFSTSGSSLTIWEWVPNGGIPATSIGVGFNNLGATP